MKVERIVRKNGELVTFPSREDSLDRLLELHIQFADESVDVMGEVERGLILDELRHCLTLLDEAERELIQAIYFEDYTERGWATVTGVSQKAVNKRKIKILAKLHKLMKF